MFNLPPISMDLLIQTVIVIVVALIVLVHIIARQTSKTHKTNAAIWMTTAVSIVLWVLVIINILYTR